jgi:hypothetical protein
MTASQAPWFQTSVTRRMTSTSPWDIVLRVSRAQARPPNDTWPCTDPDPGFHTTFMQPA